MAGLGGLSGQRVYIDRSTFLRYVANIETFCMTL